jgi:hypothetical protein
MYIYVYSYKFEYKCLCSKEVLFNVLLSWLSQILAVIYYSVWIVFFPWHSPHRGLSMGSVSCCKLNPCFHAYASNACRSTSLISVISYLFVGLMPVAVWGQNYEVCVACSVLVCTVFIILHLFMSHSCIFTLLCWLPHLHQCCMLYYFL